MASPACVHLTFAHGCDVNMVADLIDELKEASRFLGGTVRSLVTELKDCRVCEVHSGTAQGTPGEPG